MQAGLTFIHGTLLIRIHSINRGGHIFGLRFDHEPGFMIDKFQRASRIGTSNDWLCRQHRLKGDVSIIFVIRPEEYTQRIGITGQQFLFADTAHQSYP